MMEMYQFSTLVGMLATGFGLVIYQISGLDRRLKAMEKRLSIVETILFIIGASIKPGKAKTED